METSRDSQHRRRRTPRFRHLLAAVALVATAVTVATNPTAPAPVAIASSSISLDEPFTGATLVNPGNWISLRSGTLTPSEWPCLTAASVSTSASSGTIEACVNQNGPSPVNPGEGALRLTRKRAVNDPFLAAGSLLYTVPLSAAEGIDISFSIRMDDGQVADGMSFFLKDGANVTESVGAAGGGLGYGMSHEIPGLSVNNGDGLPGALFGIGFDKYGNFSWRGVASPDCPDRGTHDNSGPVPTTGNRLVLRGPDTSTAQDGSAGYCYLEWANVSYSSAAFQRVRVVVPPYTPGSPTTVSVYLAPSADPTVLPDNPTLTSGVTINATTFRFGFSAAGGWWSNNHDLRGLSIRPAGTALWTPVTPTTAASTGSGTGPTSGGTVLTITGTGISTAGVTVTVGAAPCIDVTVSSDGTTLTCATPPGPLGPQQVVMTNPGGIPGYGTFTYVNPTPTVTAVSPSSGTPDGGNTVTITGTGFIAGATATIDGQACTSVNVTSTTSLTCVAPPGTDGDIVDAAVTNLGPVTGTGTNLYTYQTPAPTPSIPATPTPTVTTTPPTTTAPAPPTPVPAPNGALPALRSGETLVTEDGAAVEVELVVENDEALVLRSPDFELRLRGACTTGCTITESDTGRETIHLERSGAARVSGFGFLPGSEVHVWVFSEPQYLGALLVADDGTYDGTFPLVAIPAGEHTLQANGISFDNLPRSANLGIVVVEPAAASTEAVALPQAGSTPTTLGLFAALLMGAALALFGLRRRLAPTTR